MTTATMNPSSENTTLLFGASDAEDGELRVRQRGDGRPRAAPQMRARQADRQRGGRQQTGCKQPEGGPGIELEHARQRRIADNHWIDEPHRMPPRYPSQWRGNPRARL